MVQRITQDGATRLTDGADVRVTEDDAGGPERISGREPLQLVEVHQDFCSRTYGVGPCRAVLPFEPITWNFMEGSLPEGAELSRATIDHNGTTISADGLVTTADAGSARFTHGNFRTNWLRNNTMVGAVVGEPGTLPDNWTTTLRGLSWDVVGLGPDYVDLRIHGTSTAAGDILIRPEQVTQIVAMTGDAWVASFYLTLLDATDPVSNFELTINGRTAGGTGVELHTEVLTPNIALGVEYRAESAITMASSLTVRVSMQFTMNQTNGQSYDFVVRVRAPQIERGLAATEVIATSGTKVTTGALLGLLNEPQDTNLIVDSEAAEATPWTSPSASVTADTHLAPDGVVGADTVTPTSATAGARSQQVQSATVGLIYHAALFVRNVSSLKSRLRDAIGGANAVVMNWSGAVPDQGVGLANDWYRVQAAGTLADTTACRIFHEVDLNATLKAVAQWGGMVSYEGSSYIPTSSSGPRTRGADVLVLAVPDATWDVTITRLDGDETIRGVVVSGGSGYVVPTSVSPLQSVAMVPVTARSDATGTRKCYNTRVTCQDTEQYEPEDLALSFARPMAVLPKGLLAIPSVVSIETAPTHLNIGAGSKNVGPFGSRAVATVTFRDHPSPDRLVDKYAADRDFDPLTRGTFWTKWLARNPYYQNRRLVIRDGYVGQSLEEMVRRDYLLDRIEGPSPDGLVRVVAKDALKLAEDERAQAPRLSQGALTASIDAAVTVFSVAPSTEQDYPDSGTLRIGRELMTYADRSEADGIVTFSGVVRGVEGTAADSHDAEERAQLCLSYGAEAVQDVLYDLLVGFGNVPAAFVDQVAWDQEAERWLQGFDLTALITEPTGVSSLVAEIIEQVPALIWWDERARLIKLRADRRDETAPLVIDERDHIVAGSVAVREDPTQRISQVWVYWRQRDPTQSASSEANFSRIRILADLEAEAADLYGESRIRKVYARWLSTDAQATVLARRLLQRFGSNPRFLTVSLDAKDRALWTADFVEAATRLVVDDTGAEVTDLYQVVSAEETVSGHTVAYDLQRASFTSGVLAGFYMADEAPNHDAASDEQKAHGAWYAAEDGTLGDGSAGYVWQ